MKTIVCCLQVLWYKWKVTYRFLMSVAPLNAFLGMDWIKFSLKSLWRQNVCISYI